MIDICITILENPQYIKGFAIIKTKNLDAIQKFNFILTLTPGNNRGNLDATFN